MVNNSQTFSSPVREIKAIITGITPEGKRLNLNSNSNLISFKLDRSGNQSKFFGYGVVQKINVKAIDAKRELSFPVNTELTLQYNLENFEEVKFYVSEVHRNEKDNSLSITAYDKLYAASEKRYADLGLSKPYTVAQLLTATATAIGCPNVIYDKNNEAFGISYSNGGNYDGKESLRLILDNIAEATQTIYFINHENKLVFKSLDIQGKPVASINKALYYDLKASNNRRLKGICATNSLGDDVTSELAESGTIQFVRDNGLWDNDNRIKDFVDKALTRVGGLTIGQYDLSWRGNPLIEIGDKIEITCKDNSKLISYLLNTTLEYKGSLQEKTSWQYEDNDNDTADNPTTIGDALNDTVARVDKVNKNIELVVKDVKGLDVITNQHTQQLASLKINADSINASVQELTDNTNGKLESMDNTISSISEKVSTTMTKDQIDIAIQKEVAKGTDKVDTKTGIKVDANGITVSKTGTEMSTNMDEDGMTIYRNNEVVLDVNKNGVNAENLHATTYLIVGLHSRFEDYDDGTGLFYIG